MTLKKVLKIKVTVINDEISKHTLSSLLSEVKNTSVNMNKKLKMHKRRINSGMISLLLVLALK